MKLSISVLVLFVLLQFENVSAEKTCKENAQFFQYLACGKGMPGIRSRSRYMLCRRKLPSKMIRMERDCDRSAIPGVELKSTVWKKICDNDSTAKKISKCYSRTHNMAHLNNIDKERVKEFEKCLEKYHKLLCPVKKIFGFKDWMRVTFGPGDLADFTYRW